MTTFASHRTRLAQGSSRSSSPYLIGVAIGLLNIGAFAAFRKGIGISGAYESSAAVAARRVAPDALHINDYVKARKEAPKFNWESWLMVGTVLGGMLAAQLERRGGTGASDDLTEPPLRSPLASATGGALLMYGARMADGCTSGHALSGTAQGAASSWVFTPLMFLVGAAVARGRRASKGAR
ncbi:MAG: YeeE/YedE family protein [Burkholderiaceae bacterium]|nr:YeeE/YedE family protein [Burkholderiaceae bacterium]